MTETAQTVNEYESFAEFRDQAAEKMGFSAGKSIAGFLISHPQNLDPDQQERYDELRIWFEESDELVRHPDGTPKEPLRNKDGKRLEPYDTRMAKAWLGANYDDFIAAGGRDIDVYRAVMLMNQEYVERKRADPKSGNGAGGAS